ncbi:MAG: hypothetical protein CL758_08345 [Chloroflexi bacterium]|nr:hypothetical protein [Chloroflexota bacterium]|tara:strand:- start:100 stop:882 length:783 start_codon:yes stop_codon:yes gene_type:complete
MAKLKDKVAIITGGNSGIGESTAHLFAKEGATVIILARRKKEGLEVQNYIQQNAGKSLFIKCDVTNSNDINKAIEIIINKFNRIDILFNNAGISSSDIFPDENKDNWESVIKVNLSGTFYMCQAVWKHLIKSNHGIIINMSSLAAQRGFSNYIYDLDGAPSASYYSAKAGIEALTRYLASIGGKHNIRVNCIRPGQIITDKAKGKDGNHKFKATFDLLQILKNPGKPENVAKTALFLASKDSEFITGEIINIDGGMPGKL